MQFLSHKINKSYTIEIAFIHIRYATPLNFTYYGLGLL